MNIIEQSKQYLNTLYLKSKRDISSGASHHSISNLLGLEYDQARNLLSYLKQKGFVDTSSGYGDNIVLTATGLDTVSKEREGKRFETIKFKGYKYLPSPLDGIEFIYFYDLIDENGKAEPKSIRVAISGNLSPSWGAQIWSSQPEREYANLAKMLLQVGKDRIIEKLKEGTLIDNEEMILLTSTHPHSPPYNPKELIEPENAEYEVQIPQKNLSEEISENKLAAAIIETRDRINAIFKQKHKEKLLFVEEERNLLDFFKTARSEEEFSHRLASLGQVSRHLNLMILRKINNQTDTTIPSVTLLENLLKTLEKPNTSVIDFLRHIGKIRQAYPMHSDNVEVFKGYKYFGLSYPIEDFETSWTTILNHYLSSLKDLQEILTDAYMSK